MEAMGRSRETVCEAAAFFIEQILLSPDADSYRVLGARPEATNYELRRNMALLLRWLHPDHDGQGARSVFVGRVTRAWNDLKTQERRAAYDQSRRIALAEKSLLRKRGGASKKPSIPSTSTQQRALSHACGFPSVLQCSPGAGRTSAPSRADVAWKVSPLTVEHDDRSRWSLLRRRLDLRSWSAPTANAPAPERCNRDTCAGFCVSKS